MASLIFIYCLYSLWHCVNVLKNFFQGKFISFLPYMLLKLVDTMRSVLAAEAAAYLFFYPRTPRTRQNPSNTPPP